MVENYAWSRLGLALCFLFLPAPLLAQNGRIVGRVLDTDGAAVAGARLEVVGTMHRATTSVEGRYSLNGVPSGMVELRVSMVGYNPKRVTGVPVISGGVTEQDLILSETAVQLQELTVSAAVERGSVGSAVDEQQQSVGIVNAISAEQISRSPDGDAAAAVQRVSGATVQDGKYVFVRGLGDRYTQAALNGARIPSPEPEKKVVPLDLFPSSLLQGITTSKTFTPDQPGDFAGASVNIRTREFPGRSFLSMSASMGLNDAVTGTSLGFAPSLSADRVAMGAGNRAIPAELSGIDWNSSITPEQRGSLVGSLRNAWSVRPGTAAPNGSFGAALGGNLPTGGTGLSYLVSGTYSAGQEARLGEVRALAAPVSSGSADELDRFEGTMARNTVLWGGVANFSTAVGSHSKITLNNTYNRTMDNEGRRETGWNENLSLPLEIQRLRYVERRIYSSQLTMHHELGGAWPAIDWGVALSGVSRQEPDRSEVVYTIGDDGSRSWLGFGNESAVRTFASLGESAVQGHLDLQWNLGRASVLRVGGLHRSVDRDADNRVYSVSLLRALPDGDQTASPEEIFSTYRGNGDYFRIAPLGAGGSYTAADRLTAGYAMVVMPLGRNLEAIAGARLEHSRVEVSSLSTSQQPSLATPEFTDLLPALALTWRIGSDVNLRLSATQTLSRPEYRELSPIMFREVIGGDNVRGNAGLQRTLIRNYDLRWEWYPGRGEVISLGFFAKDFDNPVERVYQGTSGTRIITFVNARGASNRGFEVEARKTLSFISGRLNTFTAFANATVMRSTIEIDPDAGAVTSSNRRMVGQAPYVVNAGLTWSHPHSDASATLLFNRVGGRITDAGESPLPDIIEAPRNVLDASLRLPISGSLNARFDARNLLDAEYLVTQGAVTRERYTAGRVFTIGFAWQQ
ncbi:MAG TPA: TonB-dependent receptor [Gemmatimonadales bacterium]|nr:TonB-dependent receptor [Gemmatimonadales bacterium]